VRIQNLLNRRSADVEVDAQSYLQRLTGETVPAEPRGGLAEMD